VALAAIVNDAPAPGSATGSSQRGEIGGEREDLLFHQRQAWHVGGRLLGRGVARQRAKIMADSLGTSIIGVVSSSVNGQYGAARERDHPGRDTAQDRSPEAGPAMRSHHDHIRVPRLREADDPLGRHREVQEDTGCANAGGPAARHESVELPLGGGALALQEFIDGGRRDVRVGDDREDRQDMGDDQRGPTRPRQLHRLAEGSHSVSSS
jgi:hypothetical protein